MATQVARSSQVEKDCLVPSLQSTVFNSSNMHKQGRSVSISDSSSASHSMVCVDCFHAKGDIELRIPCQNPNCRFYLQQPNRPARRNASISTAELHTSEPYRPPFSREVGYDRRHRAPPHFTFPSRPPSSSNDKLWAYPPSSVLYSARASAPPQKMRSQSVAFDSEVTGGRTMFLADRTSRLRSRLMSVPVSEAGQTFEQDCGEEDAFVSSPLVGDHKEEGRPQRRMGTPDTDIDSGIGSPYGRPSCSSVGVYDWMELSKGAHGITPSGPPTSVGGSAQAAGGDCFDMSVLRAEISSGKRYSSSTLGGYGAPTGVSPASLSTPDALKKFLMAGQFSSLINCTDTYSRKVFVGGLPPDIDDEDIKSIFVHYGPVAVDWPHKQHTKACVPPKGYAFLLFKEESSIHKLLMSCFSEDDKYFLYIPTNTLVKKKVEIRPWYVSDSQHYVESTESLDYRKAVFVGGVPRPLKASELAQVMEDKYGSLTLVAIDCDSDLKYPKGAACVVFSSHASYIAAVSARFMQLNYGNLDKKIEIKPYVLDGQMCDECHGVQCIGKPAPFFCASVTCLQYYCEYCWATVHSMPGRLNHRPLQKDIGDKARYY